MLRTMKDVSISTSISDIFDGQLYKSLDISNTCMNPSMEFSLSAVLNTDGVAVFMSSNQSFWPILLMLNELPFSERY